jgi:hypothetical protein
VRELGFEVSDGAVTVISNNEDQFISFSKKFGDDKAQFLNSFRFMSHSLDSLLSCLSQHDFMHTSKHFPADKMELFTRKGVFCYDYVDSIEQLEQTYLPEMKEFYNKLNECNISDRDY